MGLERSKHSGVSFAALLTSRNSISTGNQEESYWRAHKEVADWGDENGTSGKADFLFTRVSILKHRGPGG